MFPYSFVQMVKTKVSKKKVCSTNSDSDDYSPGSEGEVHGRPTSTKKGMSKRNVRGRGAGNPPGQLQGNLVHSLALLP
jgi:hypothetical protein